MLIRRLFGGYDPTLHSIVVKNKRKEKKKRMRQITEKSHRRGMVVWGWGGAWQHMLGIKRSVLLAAA